MKKGESNVVQFPSHRVKLRYKPVDPEDLDNNKLDEISQSLDDIESLLTFLRDDLMLIRMRIEEKKNNE